MSAASFVLLRDYSLRLKLQYKQCLSVKSLLFEYFVVLGLMLYNFQRYGLFLYHFFFFLFLVGFVEERLWWPIQSPNIGRKKKANS